MHLTNQPVEGERYHRANHWAYGRDALACVEQIHCLSKGSREKRIRYTEHESDNNRRRLLPGISSLAMIPTSSL